MHSEDIRIANRHLRNKYSGDDKLWPIRGQFSVVDRAIRRVRDLRRQGLEVGNAFEYEEIVAQQMSEIVNDPKNW